MKDILNLDEVPVSLDQVQGRKVRGMPPLRSAMPNFGRDDSLCKESHQG